MDRPAVSGPDWGDLAARLREVEACEEAAGGRRIVEVVTRVAGAPASVHLRFSHPRVMAGETDAAVMTDGSRIAL